MYRRDALLLLYILKWPCMCYSPSADGGYTGRGSPKADLEGPHDGVEEKVSTRGNASSPIGGHVADIYLANLNK